MGKRVQFIRHDTAGLAAFTGLIGEVTVNTSSGGLVTHDGVTPGGHEQALKTLANVSVATTLVAGKMSAAMVAQLNAATAQIAINKADITSINTNLLDYVTLTGAEVLTNKTLTAPVIDLSTVTSSGVLAVVHGGTGAADASTARTNLGLGSMAVQAASAVAITGGTIAGITDLAIADGGTGASNVTDARTNLGLVIGTNVQAYNANLLAIANITPTDSYFLVGNGTAWVSETGATVRTSLGLGSMAIQAASAVAITGGSIAGITDLAIADGGTGASTALAAFDNLKQAASATYEGVVELGTQAEINAGSTTKVVTGETLAGYTAATSVTNGDSHDHSGGDGAQIPTGGIADSAVTTLKIADSNVTANKIAKSFSTSNTWSIPTFGYVIPEGIYMVTPAAGDELVFLELYFAGSWHTARGGIYPHQFGGGLIVSDGTNVRLVTESTTETVAYMKLT